jgi:predicted NAD/FAD-binding protein
MAAAIWSCPTEDMRAFPFLSFARFFANHGLLDLVDRPDWETVRGGSRTYVAAMLERFRGRCSPATPVTRVTRRHESIEVETAAGERFTFDALVMGCHADEALALIESPSVSEREILGRFRYQTNRVFLHTDATLMPRRRRVWSSWNYLQQPGGDPAANVTVTYWMNSLQDLPPGRDVFVSLNPRIPPRADAVLAELTYEHPMFDTGATESQRRIGEIQGQDRIWFSGAYLGYGFHEDGLRAAVSVARDLGVRPPWETSAQGDAASVKEAPAEAPALEPATVSPS